MENETTNEAVKESSGEQTAQQAVNYEEQLSTNKDLQSFVDKKVTQGINTALEKARKQWEIEQDNQKSEAEKLATMTEKQKQEYEIKKANTERDNAILELNSYKLKEQAVKIASDKGIDVSLLDFIDFKQIKADDLTGKIDGMSTLFNKAVEKAVNEKLKESTPISQTGITETKKAPEIPNMF